MTKPRRPKTDPAERHLRLVSDADVRAQSDTSEGLVKGIVDKARRAGGKVLETVGDVLESGIPGTMIETLAVRKELLTGMSAEVLPRFKRHVNFDRILASQRYEFGDGEAGMAHLGGVLVLGMSSYGIVLETLDGNDGAVQGVHVVQLPYGKPREGLVASDEAAQFPTQLVGTVNFRDLEDDYSVITIGREQTVPEDDSVSRGVHCEVCVGQDGGVWVEAQKTPNKTFLIDADAFASNSLGAATKRMITDLRSFPDKWDPYEAPGSDEEQ